MKWILFIVALALLVVSVNAASFDFQNPDDFIALIESSGASWVNNATGGQCYISIPNTASIQYPMTGSGSPTTYVAWDIPAGNKMHSAIFWDSTHTSSLYTFNYIATGRFEAKISGGFITMYKDTLLVAGPTLITQNPSYVQFQSTGGATIAFDNLIYGTTESHYIFGNPQEGFFLMKDFLNPAASGFYRVNLTDPTGAPTLINSYYMWTDYGRGTLANESIVLNEYGGGNYQTIYTDSITGGSTIGYGKPEWNLTNFFASTAPYGLYVTTIPGTVEYSSTIPYIGSGASVVFDADQYGSGETATADIIISDGYYSTSTYDYHFVIQDIYGVEASDQPVTFTVFSPHTGQAQYTWDATDDDPGLYYGMIYATRKSDSEEFLMNYDICEVSTNVILSGYVKDATNTSAIVGANVTVNQGTTVNTLSSGVDGNYTTTADFVQDAPTTITASKTGYQTYIHTFTPAKSGIFDINITLMPTTVTYSGIAIHGIARTPPYNKTIDSATITIGNITAPFGNYTTTTNAAGYYIINDIANNTLWDIQGSKTDYSNSTVYQLLVVGS